MKDFLKILFSPILNNFESYKGEYNYKQSHRTVLVVIGSLFLLLSFISLAAAFVSEQPGAVFPFLIFFIAGLVCLVIGGLGSERAVAKLWGNTE